MSRYIDADKATMAIAECFLDMDDSFVESATECNAMIDLAIDKIKELPTADVKPVARAKWFDDFTSDWVCTNCLQPSPSKRYKYCPNCGARMVEE